MKKIFNSKLTIFFLGLVLGLLILGVYRYKTDNNSEYVYFKLKNDYCIGNIGYLKSGTLLKVDEGMSEGFTRFILYLNISDGEEVEKYNTKEKDMIIPYWLNVKDSTCKE